MKYIDAITKILKLIAHLIDLLDHLKDVGLN